jgi:hypothetical protein
MANFGELIEAICMLIKSSPVPIPTTLMNHGVGEAAAIIGAVVVTTSPWRAYRSTATDYPM